MSKLSELLRTLVNKVNSAVKTEPQTLTEEQKAQVRENIGVSEGGSGGNSPAIIDVIELPTEDIRTDVFYRKLTAKFLYGQFIKNDWTLYTVDTLPENGEMCWDGTVAVAYYSAADNSTYGYVTEALSGTMGVPAGWYPVDVLIPALGQPYGGVITDITSAESDTVYTLLTNVIYSYKDNIWSSIDIIGWRGTGESSEIFNHLSNIASGSGSHAEGYYTTASGEASHAEGCYTTASGAYSHAEGYETTAFGRHSHAEGNVTIASGDYSHAEGLNTTASGEAAHTEGLRTTASGAYSHAEGYETTASRQSQHVQGEYNIEDEEGEGESSRGKYAHIVGNGRSNVNRSNAHTLDWDGNAWYAGYVEGTALILKSPNGTRFRITVDDSGNLSAAVEP